VQAVGAKSEENSLFMLSLHWQSANITQTTTGKKKGKGKKYKWVNLGMLWRCNSSTWTCSSTISLSKIMSIITLAIYEHDTELGCPCSFISLRNKRDDCFLMAKWHW